MPDRFKEGDRIKGKTGIHSLHEHDFSLDLANAVAALAEGEINAAVERIGEEFEVLPPSDRWPCLVRWGEIGGAGTGATFTEALRAATDQQEAGA